VSASAEQAVPGQVPGRADGEPLRDEYAPRRVLQRETVYEGLVWDVVRDTVDLGEGGVVKREYVQHTGAVAILALDDDDRVLLIEQYRHPVGMTLWELPAGLLDVTGEDPLDAAKRELAEEADLRADRWDVLADWFNSPGGMTEALRLYLARGLRPVPDAERHEREAEEIGMTTRWVPLEEAREAVLAGALHNPAAVVGVLAACEGRAQAWRRLRPGDAPWPEHPAFRDR
jgi:ADP-ribose pyrophosphatase